jgi:GAF domain-containing protein
MKRRAKSAGRAAKTPLRKPIKAKQSSAIASKTGRTPPNDREPDIARLQCELNEALERQTATADVLRIISSSPGDLEPVFVTILDKALHLCEAAFGFVTTYDGERFERAAQRGVPDALATYFQGGMDQPRPGDAHWRLVEGEELIHSNQMDEDAYRLGNPLRRAVVDLGGARTALVVALRKDKVLLGALTVYRKEVRPFTDQQVSLVQNFAAQAVIAIENARLLNELRESLQQQTGTAEVLRVISSSPGELRPVFDAMLQNATRICEAKFGTLYLRESEGFRTVAAHNAPPAYIEVRTRELIRPSPDTALGGVAATKRVVHIADIKTIPSYVERNPFIVTPVELGGYRTVLAVPMLKNNELIGVITINRQEVRPFTDKQIELVQNFAAQAVIAIENARLLNELKQSLEQQTATADVLRVISSSPGELEAVFRTILKNATRICEAKFGILNLYENGGLRFGAMHNVPSAFADWLQSQRGAYQPIPGSPPDRVIRTKKVSHVLDNTAEPAPGRAATLGGARTTVSVPMLKDDELIGTITIFRQEVRAFTDEQIALLANFANQAVIAIENARLLNELRQRTEEVVKLNQQLEQRVADQVGEIERMGRLRRFLPQQVADLIVASGTEKQLESHRREITALFCDLRGFTGFSESADPEDVMTLLRHYHAAIGEIIIKYSGTLERYAGDGVMVVFNDPVPVDNPALQAVRMALDMRGALGALIEKWRRLGHELGFGIGIAHGYATLGTIGFEGRFDYAAIGTVSNVASRLCDEAKPGQILISSRVLMAVEDAIAVEPVGDFALKGISRPLAAYNVVEKK